MSRLRIMCAALLAAAASIASPARGEEKSFLSINAHLLAGASYVTNNYMGTFHEIGDLNKSMGLAAGAGVGAMFDLSRRWGLGTELNVLMKSFRMDLAVTGEGKPSVSNVFQRNRAWELDIPVYMRWRHRVADRVEWNVDMGAYFSYGLGGSQKNTIYDAKTNELGQLMTTRTELDADYYNDSDAFINSYKRADMGLHVGLGLTFAGHLTVGVRSHIGFKNVALSTGLRSPSCHNMDILAMLGWTF